MRISGRGVGHCWVVRFVGHLMMLCAVMTSVVIMTESEAAAAEPSVKDLEYAVVSGHSLKLDLFLPANVQATQPCPLIVWVHGGAWRSGSKADVPIAEMVSHGFAIASVDYRLSPMAQFPAQIHDIKGAIRFLRANAPRWNADPQKFIVAGSSAGGHLAALTGVGDGVDSLEGQIGPHRKVTSRVQAIVSFYGASNLQTILAQSTPFGLNVRVPALELFLGGQPESKPELARLASPIEHVDAHDPPLWLFHGDQDPQMPINQSHELQGAYERAVVPAKLQVLHNARHGGPEFFQPTLLQQLSDELMETLDSVTSRPVQ